MGGKKYRLKLLPSHSASLQSRDFFPYLVSRLLSGKYRRISIVKMWEPLIRERQIIPTPTGRHALWYFLGIAGLKKGDEVLIAGYNFYVIVRIIVQKGLVPVFVDIDPETLCMDAADLANKITRRSRLVVVTHMFGNPANVSEIHSICKKNKILMFEDCAHAVGTLEKTTPVGQLGNGSLFSFGIQKLLTCFGGGMLVLSNHFTENEKKFQHNVSRLKSFLDTFSRFLSSFFMTGKLYGWFAYPLIKLSMILDRLGMAHLRNILEPSRDNPHYRFDVNRRAPFKPFMKRMIQLQMARLEENISRRRAIVQRVKSRLRHLPEIKLLNEDKHGRSNGSYLGIYVPAPEKLSRYLKERGILSHPHEFYDCSNLEQFSEFGTYCEHSLYASEHLLRLPSYPSLRDAEVDYMLSAIESYFEKHTKEND